MNTQKIRIELEVKLEDELYKLLEGEIIESVLKEANFEPEQNIWKNILEGHSFKVTPEMAPSLYSLFTDVKNTLKYEKEIDFYVTNDPSLNAFAIPRSVETNNDIVNVNSGMISMLDNDELRFVVGHEIGHLISRYARINKLLNFVFPDEVEMPLILKHKIDLWMKLSELTADRFGYIASPNLEKCVSAFFKMASGLDTGRINFDYKAYLTDNEKILEYFSHNECNLLSHPVNPLRIKSIELLSNSVLYSQISTGVEVTDDKDLSAKMEKLIEVLLTLSTSELDYHRKYFLATGGLIMASVDKEITEGELETIVENLSGFTVFPREFLAGIIEAKQINEIFQKSVTEILKANPIERNILLQYLVNLAISDNEISDNEIEQIYKIGENYFGMAKREIAQIIAGVIQGRFMPNLYL
jgi:hypothetical protein